jgi:hypothetical protein
MAEPKGRTFRPSASRTFVNDLVHFAKRIPTVPVSRTIDVSMLMEARKAHPARPSWSVLFMKAYALVGLAQPTLRQAYLTFPRPHLYEHPQSVCALALERTYQGEEGVFVGLFRAPEVQTLGELQHWLDWYKDTPLEEIGFYRQALRVSRMPMPVRRFLWWSTLEVSGFKRAKRLGTFGLSSYGSLGAESLHPISPLSTTVTYGPIDRETGQVNVKVIYDHRAFDGAQIARRLRELDAALQGPILDELRRCEVGVSAAR